MGVLPDANELAAARLNAALRNNQESELTAWTQLLARWQESRRPTSGVRDATLCRKPIVFPGLDCLRGHATLEQLIRFDRPLILQLEQNGAHGYALLQSIGGDQVRLDFAGESLRLDKIHLDAFWHGDFIAVWRVPEQVPATVHSGDAGTAVAWVKAQLAHMDGAKAPDTGPAYFDAVVEERVRKLQVAYGIKPDGIVGPETLFALSALSESGPHLGHSVE